MKNAMSFSDVLREIMGGEVPVMTAKEIAGVTRVHVQTVYSWASDVSEPGYSKVMDLAHALNKVGYHKLSLQFFDNSGAEADGCTKNETIEIVRQLAKVSDATTGTEIINAGAEIKRQAECLIKEGELK